MSDAYGDEPWNDPCPNCVELDDVKAERDALKIKSLILKTKADERREVIAVACHADLIRANERLERMAFDEWTKEKTKDLPAAIIDIAWRAWYARSCGRMMHTR